MSDSDPSIENLLDLDGFIAEVGGGYWVKFEAKRVPTSDTKPHGIDYSLTLHADWGSRILGYDNAHPVRGRRGPGGRRTEYDHRHRLMGVRPYRYQDAGKLIEDFWADVDEVLRQRGVTS